MSEVGELQSRKSTYLSQRQAVIAVPSSQPALFKESTDFKLKSTSGSSCLLLHEPQSPLPLISTSSSSNLLTSVANSLGWFEVHNPTGSCLSGTDRYLLWDLDLSLIQDDPSSTRTLTAYWA